VLRAACPAAFSDQCNLLVYSPSMTIYITKPAYVIPPTIYISSPTRLGRCNDIVIDISASENSGGRAWKRVAVRLVSTSDSNSTLISSYFLKHNLTALITIPHQYTHAPNSYTFNLTLVNFLDASSSKDFRVTVVDALLPVVSISGPTVVSTATNRLTKLISSAAVSYCDGTTSSSGITYSWSITKNSLPVTSIASYSKSPKNFGIPKYTLDALSTYVFTVTVSKSMLSSNYSVNVAVGQAGVLAKIAGGSSLSKRSSDVIFLDASSSINYDVDGVTGARAGLSFLWGCIEYSPNYGDYCPHGGNLTYTNENITIVGPFPASTKIYLGSCTVTYGSQSSTAYLYVSRRIPASVLNSRYITGFSKQKN